MSAVEHKSSVVSGGSVGLPELPLAAEKSAKSPLTWKGRIWSSLDVSREERRFLTKLDITLITSAALGVMIRYLDQVNINNAFNSGMKEDLSLYGNELNYANAFWSAAYVFGQIPSNLLLTRVSAPKYIATLELLWTVFTFATAGVKNVHQLYAFRFFVGLFEAGHFPAVMYICSSYFKPHELARRNTIILIFTQVGPMFSGFLMAAVYKGLDGRGGLEGWRWLYIICGVISTPCAIWTFFAMPELPARAKANWIFTEAEVELGRQRMPTETKLYTGLFKWKDIVRWHKTWHVWLFPLFFCLNAQMGQSSGSMIFWLKSFNKRGQPQVYSIPQINTIPLGINAIGIFTGLLSSWISDSLPNSARWPILTFSAVAAFVFPLSLAATPVYPSHKGQRMALYYLCATNGGAGLAWTFVNETSRDDPEKRAYVSAMMNAFAYIFVAWVPILTFPTYKQPRIVTGNYVNAGFGFGMIVVSLLIGYLVARDRKRAARQNATRRGAESPIDEKDSLTDSPI